MNVTATQRNKGIKASISCQKQLFTRLTRTVMTSTPLLLLLALTITVISTLISVKTGQWHWLPRSGALVVSIGAILSTRRLLRICIDGLLHKLSHEEISKQFSTNTENPQDMQVQLDLKAAYYGFFVVGSGTLIWAYGDLINYLYQG